MAAPPHREAAPPPPAFEPPPERPLFAPDPDGRPARTPTPGGAGHPGRRRRWVLAVGEHRHRRGHRQRRPPGVRRRGRGGRPARARHQHAAPRRHHRGLPAGAGRLRDRLQPRPRQDAAGHHPSRRRAPAGRHAEPAPRRPLGHRRSPASRPRDFDPQGGDGENADEAALAVDGDPATAWTTCATTSSSARRGSRPGSGWCSTSGPSHDVSEVDLTTVGSPTSRQRLRLPHRPGQPATGSRSPAAPTLTGTTGTVSLDQPVTGRYVVVWLTKLPAVPGGFRGGIAEAVVKGG